MRGRRRRGVVMFWGERGEDLGRRNGKKRKEKDEQERSYRRLFFLLL